MDYIWIITFPPVYDGITMTSPSYITIMATEPTGSVLADLLAAGATIQKIPKLDGGTTSIRDNGSPVSLDYDAGDDTYTGDLSEDLGHEIDVDQETEDAESTTSFQYNAGTAFIVGESSPALPLWSTSGSGNSLYKIDNDSGSTLKTIVDSDLQYLEEGALSNFIASDDGYLYFFLPIDEGYPISTHIHLWVYDPDGNGAEILDHSGGAGAGASFIAFDRANEVLYAEFQGTTSSSYTTLYQYTKAGVLSGSSQRLKLNWTLGINCMAAYDGNVIYAHQADGGADPKVIEYGGSDIFSMSSSYSWVSNIVAPNDGYVYALYKKTFSSGFTVIKVSPDTGLVWSYEVSGATAPYSYYAPALYANDSGVSMVLLSHSGTAKTTKIDADGDLVWEKEGVYHFIDNDENYFQ